MTATTHIAAPQPFYVMQDLVTLHARYEQTGGGFFAMEVDVAPGDGPPPLHTHPAPEFFWTLEGELTYFRDDDTDGLTEITGGPGTNAFIPGGVAHVSQFLRQARPLPGRAQPTGGDAGLPGRGRDCAGRRVPEPKEVLAIGQRFGLVTLDIVPEPQG